LLLLSLSDLVHFIAHRGSHPMPSLVFATAVTARSAFATFLLSFMVFSLFRLRPRAKARGVVARVVALFGAFAPTLFVLLPRHDDSVLLNLASFGFIAVGNLFAIYGVSHLNRSSSIMAEARRLVTTGPYRVVQHPVYLFEEIGVVGVMLPSLWPPRVGAVALLLFAAHLGCQLLRMRNEEDVLTAAFPQHAEYRRHTARLVPGVY
jgi:protein-S-isoprenylcysteine O-methyltransferase Ste14